jgi:hypothetical protein
MAIVLLGLVVLAVLVWAGRKPVRVSNTQRMLSALFAAVVAVAAVASALRGGWIPSLVLVAMSAYLGQTARRGAAQPRAEELMSLQEARSILGVNDTASRTEIIAAYRRLMQRAHPDHGGSTGLAAQLNAARDRLLGRT